MNEGIKPQSDEPVQDESAEREALQKALECLDRGGLLDAIFFLGKSQNPDAANLRARLHEQLIYDIFNYFDSADLNTGEGVDLLKHDVVRIAVGFMKLPLEIKSMMSPEANELGVKMMRVEAVYSEVARTAKKAKDYYELLGDQDKVSEMEVRMAKDEMSEEPHRIDESYYLDAVHKFIEDTKDFSRLSQEEIDQQVSEIRGEVQQMLEQVSQ